MRVRYHNPVGKDKRLEVKEVDILRLFISVDLGEEGTERLFSKIFSLD